MACQPPWPRSEFSVSEFQSDLDGGSHEIISVICILGRVRDGLDLEITFVGGEIAAVIGTYTPKTLLIDAIIEGRLPGDRRALGMAIPIPGGRRSKLDPKVIIVRGKIASVVGA